MSAHAKRELLCRALLQMHFYARETNKNRKINVTEPVLDYLIRNPVFLFWPGSQVQGWFYTRLRQGVKKLTFNSKV